MIDFACELEQALPPFASADDLVRVGIYGSVKTAANDRWAGRGPDFIRLQRRVRYPRSSVISYVERNARQMKVGA